MRPQGSSPHPLLRWGPSDEKPDLDLDRGCVQKNNKVRNNYIFVPMKDIADLLARILIAFLFIYEAIDGVVFYEKTKATMTAYGITWRQDLLLCTLLTLLFVGGFLVLIGYYANIGAMMLLVYWVPFTLIVYSFWNDQAEFKRLHALYFMRNLAMCGGLLLLIANGAGKYSVRRLIYILKLPQ
jgi:putative oxidoreductase